MSEQQDHLKNLVNQRTVIANEIQSLNAQISQKRELLLRASGAIEYLTQIGVELPAEESKDQGETKPEIEGEVVNAEGDIPDPTQETPEG